MCYLAPRLYKYHIHFMFLTMHINNWIYRYIYFYICLYFLMIYHNRGESLDINIALWIYIYSLYIYVIIKENNCIYIYIYHNRGDTGHEIASILYNLNWSLRVYILYSFLICNTPQVSFYTCIWLPNFHESYSLIVSYHLQTFLYIISC